MSVLSVTKDNFNELVLQSGKTVLIDLWAPWCGPCRMLGPVVEKVAEQHPDIQVCKINVDDEPALAQQFGVSAIPMLAVVKNGKIASTKVGLRPQNEIEAML